MDLAKSGTMLSKKVDRLDTSPGGGGGRGAGVFFGWGCAGTPNWPPALEKISPKIDTPF